MPVSESFENLLGNLFYHLDCHLVPKFHLCISSFEVNFRVDAQLFEVTVNAILPPFSGYSLSALFFPLGSLQLSAYVISWSSRHVSKPPQSPLQ